MNKKEDMMITIQQLRWHECYITEHAFRIASLFCCAVFLDDTINLPA